MDHQRLGFITYLQKIFLVRSTPYMGMYMHRNIISQNYQLAHACPLIDHNVPNKNKVFTIQLPGGFYII